MPKDKVTGDDFTVGSKTITQLLAQFQKTGVSGMTELQTKIVTAIEDNPALKAGLVNACDCGGIFERAQSFEGLICSRCGKPGFLV